MRKLYLFCLTCISVDRYGPFPSRSGCEVANQEARQTRHCVSIGNTGSSAISFHRTHDTAAPTIVLLHRKSECDDR
jgi:hypothetical protein